MGFDTNEIKLKEGFKNFQECVLDFKNEHLSAQVVITSVSIPNQVVAHISQH